MTLKVKNFFRRFLCKLAGHKYVRITAFDAVARYQCRKCMMYGTEMYEAE
jgi:hypothetical protein